MGCVYITKTTLYEGHSPVHAAIGGHVWTVNVQYQMYHNYYSSCWWSERSPPQTCIAFHVCVSVYRYTYIASLRKQHDRGTCTDLLLEPKRHVFTAMIPAKAVIFFIIRNKYEYYDWKRDDFWPYTSMCWIRVDVCGYNLAVCA